MRIEDDDDLDRFLADTRRATDAIEPPPDFAARVVARAMQPRGEPAWWTLLGSVGRRVVPCVAVAAAIMMGLAWSADARLDETAESALDVVGDLP